MTQTKQLDVEPESTVVPIRGMRAMIASKMHQSLNEGAQLTHQSECDLTSLLNVKTKFSEQGKKVSVEDLLNFCIIKTLGKHPDLNGSIVEGKQVVLQSHVNLSLAIALPGNLLVAPCIMRADQLSVEELNARRKDLTERAKANKLSMEEMTKGSFTVSNLGLTRVHHFTPIINMPQIAILGLGASRQMPRLNTNGNVEFYPSMGLSLTFDHRAVDGLPAAQFLTDICLEIENIN